MKIVIEDCTDNTYRLRNFGKGILHSHLRSTFSMFEKYLLNQRFKECHLAFDTLNTDAQTIELRYTGNLSIQEFFANLKEWQHYRGLTDWTINLIETN
jgi:hypothetical protein